MRCYRKLVLVQGQHQRLRLVLEHFPLHGRRWYYSRKQRRIAINFHGKRVTRSVNLPMRLSSALQASVV